MENETPVSRIDALASQMETLRSEITELDALTDATEEQSLRMDAAIDEFDQARAEHDRLVERAAKVEAVRQAATKPSNLEGVRQRGEAGPAYVARRDPFEGAESIRFSQNADGNVRMGSADIISRAQSAFENVRGLSSTDHEALMERIEMVPGAAEHALVHGTPAYRAAFANWMQSQGQNVIYSGAEAEAVRTALSLTGANGGYTLPTLLDPSLIKTSAVSKNPIRRLATVVQGTQNQWNGVTVGAVTSYWTAQATAMTDGNPTFAQAPVPAHKVTAYLPGSFEIFEDSSLQSQLPALIAESFDYLESDAFVTGSGSGAPTGIVTALTTSSHVSATTAGAFSTASAADVFKVLNAIPSRFEDDATWVANKAVFNIIKQMSTGSQGAYFWSDFNNGVGEGNGLLGSSIAKSSAMTSTVTTGSVLLVLGDFSRYVIYDRLGTVVEFNPIVVDGSGLPTGQRALIAHKRVGGACTDTNAFRALKL